MLLDLSTVSSLRDSSLKEGSPTIEVPPPISEIGLWPVACIQCSIMIWISEPHAARRGRVEADIAAGLARPVGILNLGGVGNLTWIGGDGAMIAFDTGPANGLINRWIESRTGEAYDADGAYAAAGTVDQGVLDDMLAHGWFAEPPPKSLDRYSFTEDAVSHLARDDGAATLTRFTAETVAVALRHVPAIPARLIVAGGGRRNPTLMAMIAEACGVTPEPIEAVGWDGDATEAEGFAYMAVRSLRGLPISFPGTTGVPRPLTGGVLHRARPLKEAVS
jgi:anhydro-N-acetylmuramic acid kinase